MTDTQLDHVFAGETAPDAARLAFYAALADAELYLLLAQESAGEVLEPELFPVECQHVALVFDTEARLAEFTEGPAPYAALPGRVLIEMLSGQGIALGLNLGVAPSSALLPPDVLGWIMQTLGLMPPDILEARIEEVRAPANVPDALLARLAQKLSQSQGLAEAALLSEVVQDGGARSHVLAIIGASERSQAALTRAVHEALGFSGVEAGFLDVAFLTPEEPLTQRMRSVAYVFDIPKPAETTRMMSPGSDPDQPPRLR